MSFNWLFENIETKCDKSDTFAKLFVCLSLSLYIYIYIFISLTLSLFLSLTLSLSLSLSLYIYIYIYTIYIYHVYAYTRMLRAILNKSWQQHPTRHQLYGHLPPITKTIQVRRTRHAGHCWRSRDELLRDVLLWIPTHGRAKAGRPARTYIQQLCEDAGCCPEDLPRAMSDREEWRERVRDIGATSAIWWWWWCIYLFFLNHTIQLPHICKQ